MYLKNSSCPMCNEHNFIAFDDSSGAECANCGKFIPDKKLFELCETCKRFTAHGSCTLNWVCGLNCSDYLSIK